jgi:hypothetical protein
MTNSEKEAIIFALEEAKKVAMDFDGIIAFAIGQFIEELSDCIGVDE